MRASIYIRYDAGNDMLELWYNNEESYYMDTGERYEPAAKPAAQTAMEAVTVPNVVDLCG